MEKIIETARVRLRPLTESDFVGYQRLLTLPAVAVANGSPTNPTPAQVKRWLAADRRSPFAFTVEDKSTRRFMGTILYYQHTTETGEPSETDYDLGYFLDPVDWGQGIMPEAIVGSLALVQQAKQQEQSVWATCYLNNQRSYHVLVKLGFQLMLDSFVGPTVGGKPAAPQALFRLILPATEK
ncbi:GNAT family N-acetyltransferase [Levilactobacillus cerevisiae]|uniref:GNAT family N-acetyltransferase n=1 Tax=Levilactobacillus cerevisiae TaxID=1704076 RepID=UPI000F78F737|nr:GNAT family N-acetyltransferase [Levilactobacillus cerevisiae]